MLCLGAGPADHELERARRHGCRPNDVRRLLAAMVAIHSTTSPPEPAPAPRARDPKALGVRGLEPGVTANNALLIGARALELDALTTKALGQSKTWQISLSKIRPLVAKLPTLFPDHVSVHSWL